MPLFIVFLKFRIPGVGVSGDQRVRYIDSQWANWKHATERKNALSASLTMFGVVDWEVSILNGTVSDAAIAEDKEEKPEVSEKAS